MIASLHFDRVFEATVPFIIFLVTVFAGYIIRKVMFLRLTHWAAKTRSQVDDAIIEGVKGPFILWFMMLGIYFALESSQVPGDLARIVNRMLLALGIFSVTLALSNIVSRLITVYSVKVEGAFPVTSLTRNISRAVILGVGIMVILNSLGVSVVPILATLGIGGLAVALGLQDTLSNLFSGFYIIISKQVKVGDYIKLESGEEGYVHDITWRATKIRMLSNNTVLVPNERLTKAIVVNYCIPNKELAVLVDLTVHYKSNLDLVERITNEVAKEVMRDVNGGVPAFDPFIRYHTFGDAGIKFSVIMQGREFTDQYLIKHEFIKRLQQRYNREQVIIPYPVTAINYEQEKSA